MKTKHEPLDIIIKPEEPRRKSAVSFVTRFVTFWFLTFALSVLGVILLLAITGCRHDDSPPKRYPPYTILCDTNGNYCVTGKDGRVDTVCRDEPNTYEGMAAYLEWLKRYDQRRESGEAQIDYLAKRALEALEREAFRNRQWQTCETNSAKTVEHWESNWNGDWVSTTNTVSAGYLYTLTNTHQTISFTISTPHYERWLWASVPDDNNWHWTNIVFETTREPVVTKTNGEWRIGFK